MPHAKPLKLFDGNTAHSTGYFWQRGGGVYFGGKLWHQDSDWARQYYSSGRWGARRRLLQLQLQLLAVV